MNKGAERAGRVGWGGFALGLLSILKQRLAAGGMVRQHFLWACLRKAYRALIVRLLARTGLFDREYYLQVNPDVARGGCDPLMHYVCFGEVEGRQPMPLFDPAYYRAHAGGSALMVNCLLHYAWIGRRRGISPSRWFDPQHYRSLNPDVADSGEDLLQHYLQRGGIQGRSPCAQFDAAYYLRTNPEVAKARVNPLLHYLSVGRAEGRRPLPPSVEFKEVEPKCLLPTQEDWSMAFPHPDSDAAGVDVIVPVYKGYTETLRCLFSVLTAPCQTPYALIVIDDASPDAELAAELRRLAGAGLFTLLVNDKNEGFVRTVNRGMSLHENRDVVLLNSDTEVYNDWLDRLCGVAAQNPLAGSVTPLSNSATICSYPQFPHDNPYPLEIDYAELDRTAARVNPGVVAEAPTGVGFCMYIRRSCLGDVGLFDAEAFGRGYGEENDFCQRALQRGWRNLITAEVFVRHWGGTSFEGEKGRRVEEALRILRRRYPHYEQDVAGFIASDPLLEARRQLDWERLKHQVRAHNVLIVCHNRGGGTERHVQEDVQRLEAEGHAVFLLRPTIGDVNKVMLMHRQVRLAPNLANVALADLAILEGACRELQITEVHTHSFVDFAPQAAAAIRALAQALGARLDISIHDYEVICPRINLVDEKGLYCGEPDETGCNRCLAARGSEFRVADIRQWRHRYSQTLLAADQVSVPDEDVSARLTRYFPGLKLVVSPHQVLNIPDSLREPALRTGQPLRIVVVGAIGRCKGYDILLECAADAKRRKLPLEFVLMGYSLDDAALQKFGVRVTGRYEEACALEMLHELNPGVVWLPSTWPETYSYTLSLALEAGYPVFAFDLGAIASRLRALNRPQYLLKLAGMTHPDLVNEQFMSVRSRALAATANGALLTCPASGERAAVGATN